MTHINARQSWGAIYSAYPDDSDCSSMDNFSLRQLAWYYKDDSDTATLALRELQRRKDPRVIDISISILKDSETNRDLKSFALGSLSSLDFSRSIEYLKHYGLSDDIQLVKSVIDIVANIDDEQMDQCVIDFASVLSQKVKTDHKQYITDSAFMKCAYEGLLARYGVA